MVEERIALIGNPNIGKSSLFNQLTGLKQHVGNYPGITVDKTTGKLVVHGKSYRLYDLPGIYSIYPNAQDEEIVPAVLLNPKHPDHPDKLILVANAANLKRSLLLIEQVVDLKIPSMLVINMMDEAEKKRITIDLNKLESHFGIPVVLTNARKGIGVEKVKERLNEIKPPTHHIYEFNSDQVALLNEVGKDYPGQLTYFTWQLLAQRDLSWLPEMDQAKVNEFKKNNNIIPRRLQVAETLGRYKAIDHLLEGILNQQPGSAKNFTTKIDKWVMHPVWGYIIFGALLFIIFQSIFTLSEYPMNLIEQGMAGINSSIKRALPAGPLSSFISDGIISGLGGIVVFIPQIFILFLFLLLMEQSGYMSRVVFLMDRWMQPFGLNGKSVVPLISGAACAVPAIMSARNIDNRKERLITILVTPFMTCSARLPVYTMIIGLVIPSITWGGIQLQGVVLLGMYGIGVASALLAGWLLQRLIKSRYKSYLIIELPPYQLPQFKGLAISLYDKVKSFVWGAGKIILALSMVLWVLASFGPTSTFKNADQLVRQRYHNVSIEEKEIQSEIASFKLQHSYLGYLGKGLEPFIRPLGFDWKMGIGILSSFAAREVFVPTMATIYSMESDLDKDGMKGLKERMKADINPQNGKPVYGFASGISLLLFYAFAMMCMSTVATVKRETKTWRWPLIQLFSMTALAYFISLIMYQILV